MALSLVRRDYQVLDSEPNTHGLTSRDIDCQSTVVFSTEWTLCRPFLACGIAHAHMKETGPGGNISVD